MCGHGAEFREAADNNNQFSSIDGAISEFLLPNTGIIYATRNDALPDMSASGPYDATRLALSAVDFKLDPTRRPNAIMLVDGDRLDRERSPVNEYHEEEKGLILDDPQTYVGLPGATYDRYAIPGADQRPNDCRPLSDYPDNPS